MIGEVIFYYRILEKLERWGQDHNHCRPHSPLGDLAPLAFAGRTVAKHTEGRFDAENLRASVV